MDSDRVTDYAEKICSGDIVAGPYVRGACDRHINDLSTGHERGLTWDYEAAERFFRFCSNVLKLNGGEFEGKPFELLDWQAFILGSIYGWKGDDGYRRFRSVYIETGKGSGKSPMAASVGMYGLIADEEPRAEVYAAAPLSLETEVPTPSGWTTQGSLKVGDKVFDENGHVCEVTYLSPILYNRECYEVVFDDGTIIVSDGAHRWTTEDTRGQKPGIYKPSVVTTSEIASSLRSPTGRLRHRIPLGGALDLPDIELPIDPYTLGTWLGDGRSNRGSISYHKDDTEHLDSIREAGYIISKMNNQNNTRYSTILGLRTQLRENGLLDNKHVPDIYLRASKDQRLALLAGLMDTDGTATKAGECRFTNREYRLASAVHELSTGLGIRTSLREVEVTGKPHYIVSFKAPKSLRVFNHNRKHIRQINEIDTRAKGRYIKEIRRCDKVPVRCIEVSSKSHLYLVTRSHIATHNTKKDQAMILFRDAVSMVDQSPLLSKNIRKSGTGQNVWNLAHLKSGSFFRPIAADDSASGPRPHVSLLDEVHEHKNRTIVEMLRAGTKGRRQALTFMITNSGIDRTSICRDYHEYGAKICKGSVEDDDFFAYICSIDKDDDPFKSEECWVKANPSLGITIPLSYLRGQVKEARGMPAKESTVRRLNFCEWVDAGEPWISSAIWRGAASDRKTEEFYGRTVYAGLDMASTQDITALVLAVEPEGTEPWHLIPYFWLPKDNITEKSEKDRVPYDAWAKEGLLELTEGAALNKRAIVKRLAEINSHFDLKSVAYDKWRIEDLTVLLDEEGIELEMEGFGQGFRDMSPALQEFESLLINNNLHHNNNSVMTWCAANAVIEEDPAGNQKLNKKKSTGRIDGLVAAVMAIGVSVTAKNNQKPEEQIFI